MAGRVVIFIGPTLPAAEAASICDGLCLPPAEQGSVYHAARYLDPSAIVIIDGAFGHVPAVRHKEILWALHRGIPCYGAASMGALRAAELHGHGMIGCGVIYRWYRLMTMADDDAVAVGMGPVELGAPALSEALVNMRITVRRAEAAGIIDGATRRRLSALAAATYFPERSYPRLVDDARREGLLGGPAAERLAGWLAKNAVDQKRRDAIALLKSVSSGRLVRRMPASDAFVHTEAWVADLAEAGLEVS